MPAPVVCPRCTAPFQCGVDTKNCWCRDVALSDSTRAAFAEFYEGCLCSDCLTALEKDRPDAPSVITFLKAQLRRKRA